VAKVNCWEFEKCGREPGGLNEKELGPCPAATMKEADGFCGGINGGRACTYITGTYCSGNIQGTHRDKLRSCINCDFYALLQKEEGAASFTLNFNNYVKEKINK